MTVGYEPTTPKRLSMRIDAVSTEVNQLRRSHRQLRDLTTVLATAVCILGVALFIS